MRGVWVSAVLVLLGACWGNRADEEARARVSAALGGLIATEAFAVGEIHVRRAQQPFWEPAGIGATFMPGDWLRAGKGSGARVEFVEGGRLELEEDAMVVIERGSEADAGVELIAQLRLGEGSLKGHLEKAGKAVDIETPEGGRARLIARSSREPVEYRLSKSARGTAVAVQRGEAGLAAAGQEQQLRAGQAAELKSAQDVPTIFQLLPAPSSYAPPEGAVFLRRPDLQLKVSWTPVARAAGYRLQWASDASFHSAQSIDLEEPRTALGVPEADQVFFRVASRDAEGRVGLFGGSRRLSLVEPASTHRLVRPSQDQALVAARLPLQVGFAWAGDAPPYRLMVCRGSGLSEGCVAELEVEGEEVVLPLGLGTYAWGVFDSAGRPLFQRVGRFRVASKGKEFIEVPSAIENWGE